MDYINRHVSINRYKSLNQSLCKMYEMETENFQRKCNRVSNFLQWEQKRTQLNWKKNLMKCVGEVVLKTIN